MEYDNYYYTIQELSNIYNLEAKNILQLYTQAKTKRNKITQKHIEIIKEKLLEQYNHTKLFTMNLSPVTPKKTLTKK